MMRLADIVAQYAPELIKQWASCEEHLGNDADNGDDHGNNNFGEILSPPRLGLRLRAFAPMRKDGIDRALCEVLSST